MGTAGAYGGTGGRPWRDVRDLFDDLASSHGDGGGDSDSGDRDDVEYQDGGPLSDDLSAIGNALAIALSADDPALDGPPSGLPIGSLLPVRRERGGGGGGGVIGGSLRGESSATGRTGQGSTRSVARSAARGGVAIGGAYALRFGDRSALAELGLDLEELRSLGPRSQCARILDAVLGEAGHPDETALRAAAAEQLKAIVMLETPPSEADALREFVAAYVFQMGLIELRSDLASGAIDVSAASRTEKRIRRYIRTRVMQLDVPAGGSMRIADISAHAERLVGEAIGLLRAR